MADKVNAQAWLAAQDQLQPLQDQIEHISGEQATSSAQLQANSSNSENRWLT